MLSRFVALSVPLIQKVSLLQILPPGAETFSEAMRLGAEVYQVLKVLPRLPPR